MLKYMRTFKNITDIEETDTTKIKNIISTLETKMNTYPEKIVSNL